MRSSLIAPLLISAASLVHGQALAPAAVESSPPAAVGAPGPVDDAAGENATVEDGAGRDASADSQSAEAFRPDYPAGTPADVVEAAMGGATVNALTDALRRTYWTNPTVLAQRAASASVDYRVPQARAAYGPRLDFELSYGRTYNAVRATLPFTTSLSKWDSGLQRTATTSAILTQPLFTFGRNAANERYALNQVAYQRQVLRSSEQQAMLDTITAYVSVLRDRANIAIAQDNLELLERELRDNQARLSAHEVTSADVQQVETRVELGRAQVFTAQRDAASSEASFVREVGGPAGLLTAPPQLRLPVQSLEDAYTFAEGHNPVLLAAREREKVSRSSLASTKADLMPRVDFRGQADYSRQANDLAKGGCCYAREHTKELRGEIVISGPIYESGLRQAKVGEAAAANDADWRLTDAALRENRATLAATWDDWKAQSAAIERYAKAVASARSAYEGAQLQEKAGLRTTLDVLDLARELLLANTNYNSAIAGAYAAQARVLAALGSLELTWLAPGAESYDPEKHFDRVRHNGDFPVLTPLIRTLDGAAFERNRSRPIRDPGTAVRLPAIQVQPDAPAPK